MERDHLTVMDFILLFFWTLDLIQAFNVGIYDRGAYITSHRKIICNYLKTWFVIDIMACFPFEHIINFFMPMDALTAKA